MGKHKPKLDKKEKEKKKAERKQAIDENVAKQVQEMELRLKELTEQAGKVENRMRMVELERRRCELTRTEIEKFPEEGANFYRPFGRMFMQSTKPEILTEMTKMIEDKGSEIPRLKQTHAQFEAKMSSEANSLKELVGVENLRAMFGGMGISGAESSSAPNPKAASEAGPKGGKGVGKAV